jgi:hypothetical protein
VPLPQAPTSNLMKSATSKSASEGMRVATSESVQSGNDADSLAGASG